jgi:uncharacterized protein (TIGR03084 family)
VGDGAAWPNVRDVIDEAAALREQHRELADVLVPLGDSDWSRPVPRCPGWTVTDVLLHLAQSDEMARASLDGTFADVAAQLMGGAVPAGPTVDDAVEAMVGAQRALHSGAEVRDRVLDAARLLDEAFAVADPHARVPWVAGDLSARTLSVTRLAENWIHTGDIADAVGAALPSPGERLRHVARLAWRTLPYAFSRAGRTLAGPVTFDLVGPTGGAWRFEPESGPPAATVVTGDGVDLCLVAARRVDPKTTSLRAEGPDADAVLELVRTYA